MIGQQGHQFLIGSRAFCRISYIIKIRDVKILTSLFYQCLARHGLQVLRGFILVDPFCKLFNPLFFFFSLLPVPTRPPTNVKVVSSTLSSIEVSWGAIPKDYRNGVILGYVVFYRESTSGSWSKHDANLAYAKELTGLKRGKSYFVRVAGYTKIGRGTLSGSKRIIVGGSTFP